MRHVSTSSRQSRKSQVRMENMENRQYMTGLVPHPTPTMLRQELGDVAIVESIDHLPSGNAGTLLSRPLAETSDEPRVLQSGGQPGGPFNPTARPMDGIDVTTAVAFSVD